jgi:hypothetical protein
MALDRRLSEEFRRQATASAPTVAPDALDAVVARAAGVRRRRVVAVVATVAIAVVVVLAVLPGWSVLGRTPAPAGPAPTPKHSTLALPQTHRSPLYGYQMSFPVGWTLVPGRKAWTFTGPDRGPTSEDRYQSPGKPAIFVSSQRLPAGMTDAQWLTDYLPAPNDPSVAMPQCFPPRSPFTPVVIDGHAGGIDGGDYGCSFTEAVVIANHVAYVFTAQPDPDHVNTAIFDMGVFGPMLASVQLFAPTG